MKKAIIILSVFFSLSVSAQKKDTVKVDTVKTFLQENVLTVQEFQTWLFEKITAKQYSEFLQYYEAYLNEQFEQWKKKKFKK